jgi:hypothetical protein
MPSSGSNPDTTQPSQLAAPQTARAINPLPAPPRTTPWLHHPWDHSVGPAPVDLPAENSNSRAGRPAQPTCCHGAGSPRAFRLAAEPLHQPIDEGRERRGGPGLRLVPRPAATAFWYTPLGPVTQPEFARIWLPPSLRPGGAPGGEGDKPLPARPWTPLPTLSSWGHSPARRRPSGITRPADPSVKPLVFWGLSDEA